MKNSKEQNAVENSKVTANTLTVEEPCFCILCLR